MLDTAKAYYSSPLLNPQYTFDKEALKNTLLGYLTNALLPLIKTGPKLAFEQDIRKLISDAQGGAPPKISKAKLEEVFTKYFSEDMTKKAMQTFFFIENVGGNKVRAPGVW